MRQKVFLLSVIPDDSRLVLMKQIRSLRGIVSNSLRFDSRCNIVIAGKVCRSEKVLCALALGRWIVKESFIKACFDARQWLHPSNYEWEEPAMAYWRLMVNERGIRPFAEWKVALLVNRQSDKNVYKSILKYGGAVVAEEISTDATHIFYDSFHAATVMSNKSSSCLCFDVRFIGNYLFGCGIVDGIAYNSQLSSTLSMYENRNSCQRIPLADVPGKERQLEVINCMNSACSYERSEPANHLMNNCCSRSSDAEKIAAASCKLYVHLCKRRDGTACVCCTGPDNNTIQNRVFSVSPIDKTEPVISRPAKRRRSSTSASGRAGEYTVTSVYPLTSTELSVVPLKMIFRRVSDDATSSTNDKNFAQECQPCFVQLEPLVSSSTAIESDNLTTEEKSGSNRSSEQTWLERSVVDGAELLSADSGLCLSSCQSVNKCGTLDTGSETTGSSAAVDFDLELSHHSKQCASNTHAYQAADSHELEDDVQLRDEVPAANETGGTACKSLFENRLRRSSSSRSVSSNSVRRSSTAAQQLSKQLTLDVHPSSTPGPMRSHQQVNQNTGRSIFVENELEAELYKLIMSRAVTTILEKVRFELLTSRSPVPSKTSLKLLIECALSEDNWRCNSVLGKMLQGLVPFTNSAVQRFLAVLSELAPSHPATAWCFIEHTVRACGAKQLVGGSVFCPEQQFICMLIDVMAQDLANNGCVSRHCFVHSVFWTAGNRPTFNVVCQKLLSTVMWLITSPTVPTVTASLLRLVTMVTQCLCGELEPAGNSILLASNEMVWAFATRLREMQCNRRVDEVLSSLSAPWLSLALCDMLIRDLSTHHFHRRQCPLTLTLIASEYFNIQPVWKMCAMNDDCSATTSPPVPRRKSSDKANLRGETPLHVACIKGNTREVQALLQMPGLDVNAADHCGWTALHEAANHGHVACVQLLLDYRGQSTVRQLGRVDLLAAGTEGITPLHDAVICDHTEVVCLLLQYGGANLLKVADGRGLTPLEYATSDDMRRLLHDHCQEHDSSAMNVAAAVRYVLVLKRLLLSYFSCMPTSHRSELRNLSDKLHDLMVRLGKSGVDLSLCSSAGLSVMVMKALLTCIPSQD